MKGHYLNSLWACRILIKHAVCVCIYMYVRACVCACTCARVYVCRMHCYEQRLLHGPFAWSSRLKDDERMTGGRLVYERE